MLSVRIRDKTVFPWLSCKDVQMELQLNKGLRIAISIGSQKTKTGVLKPSLGYSKNISPVLVTSREFFPTPSGPRSKDSRSCLDCRLIALPIHDDRVVIRQAENFQLEFPFADDLSRASRIESLICERKHRDAFNTRQYSWLLTLRSILSSLDAT